MKARLIVSLAALIATSLAAAPRAGAGELFHHHSCCCDGWNAGYYDVAWGMPMAVVVPPIAHKQSNYHWGVGGYRVDHVGAQFYSECPGPASLYNQRWYMPAPPQPSDTAQMGDYYVRGPKH